KKCLELMHLLILVLQLAEMTCRNKQKQKLCCFSYFKSRIPERVVKNFELTISTCKIPGVILHTNKKLEICANPTQLWVQKLMNVIKTRIPICVTPLFHPPAQRTNYMYYQSLEINYTLPLPLVIHMRLKPSN
uniref:C-C motif chemokine n=1 Tax=Electrophorus electricus TaxID=8005 RepID=A0AAY5EU24_ELEEL